MKIILLISFLLTINLTSIVKIQENETDEKITLSELLVKNEQLASILDSLTITEKKCSYYDSLMVWVISISNIDHSKYLIELQIIRRLNRLRRTSNPYGYFYHNRILFIARNHHIDDLFTITDKKKEFLYKKWDMPRPERYSMWHYYYENGEFIFKGDFRVDIDCQ